MAVSSEEGLVIGGDLSQVVFRVTEGAAGLSEGIGSPAAILRVDLVAFGEAFGGAA